MNPRFQRDSSNPKFVGASGKNQSVSLDGDRRPQPDSTDGTLIPGAVFRDLATGEEWWWDGNAWNPVVDKIDLLRAEVVAGRQASEQQAAAVIDLLCEIRDLLRQIA